MSQVNMWDGRGDPPPEIRAIPIEITLPVVGVRKFHVWHGLFENHAEGARSHKVWLELRSDPVRSPEYVLHVRWPARLLHLLAAEVQKHG